MTERWRFIDFAYHTPAYNMALDEALLEWHSKGLIPPTIRFYGWNPATLSLGYFQKAKEEINLDKIQEHQLGLVRRLTGGRAVLHDKELTYSVIVSESHHQMPKTVTEAYRVISEGLLEGFKELGLDAYFAIPQSEADRAKLKDPRSANCFDAPSWYELVVEGKKIAGSAQTRQRGVILQHGSILLDLDEDKLFDLFVYPNERIKERLQKSFTNKAVTINSIAKRKVDIDMTRKAFKTGFENALNVVLEPYQLSESEIRYVEELAINRYESTGWTFMR